MLSELKSALPQAGVQPNFVYKPATWDNSDPNRSIPSDYDLAEHWHGETINLPEAWKTMGGCVGDDTCGGDPTVIVAF
jgi:hypothetical protein